MVGGQIGHQRHMGTAFHIHQLEGAELHHCKIRRLHLPDTGQQGRADVAAQPDGFAFRFQHLRDQGGGGGFAIGAGYRQDGTGADLKKHLHLGSDLRTLGPQGFQRRITGVHTGGTEHQVRLQAVQVSIAHAELAACGFQVQNLLIQLLPGRLIAAQHLAAKFQQQPHQRAVADTQAKYGDFLIF